MVISSEGEAIGVFGRCGFDRKSGAGAPHSILA
jgi:hypothetical protein